MYTQPVSDYIITSIFNGEIPPIKKEHILEAGKVR